MSSEIEFVNGIPSFTVGQFAGVGRAELAGAETGRGL